MEEESTSLSAFKNSPRPSSKHTTYFSVYDHLFRNYRGKKITLVEVGILNGGSLFMWREFFGPDARIIWVDLNPEVVKFREYGFEIFVGSQSDPNFWREVTNEIGTIDILIDDGGHNYIQQIVTAECTLENISDGGMLIVEDTHTSYLEGFGNTSLSFINYCKIWVDKINARFGALENRGGRVDKRVWSVEFFESIVVFKINRVASEMKSEPIWNEKPVKGEEDFSGADIDIIEENQDAVATILQKAFSL